MISAPHILAPPPRTLTTATAIAAVVAVVLFAIDVWVPHRADIGVLYVVPILIAALPGPPRFLPIAGAVASMLTIAAGAITNGASSPTAWSYRAFGLVVVWMTVVALSRARQ